MQRLACVAAFQCTCTYVSAFLIGVISLFSSEVQNNPEVGKKKETKRLASETSFGKLLLANKRPQAQWKSDSPCPNASNNVLLDFKEGFVASVL